MAGGGVPLHGAAKAGIEIGFTGGHDVGQEGIELAFERMEML